MSLANLIEPVNLDQAHIDVQLSRSDVSIPADIQSRVDSAFEKHSDKAEAESGKRPTKGEVGVIRSYGVLENGVQGVAGVATFDQVLYFARSQIPQGDYDFGKQLGFPLASWAIPLSSDGQLIFVRKRGAEGAYEGNPYSGFGSLVSVGKDFRDDSLNMPVFLQRSVGGEVGEEAWKMFAEANLLGLNDHDENSNRVNNGYDLALEVRFDAPAQRFIDGLSDNPQFTSKKEAIFVPVDPNTLRTFAESHKLSHSGIVGLFSYIGSRYGIDEARSQLKAYQDSGGRPIPGSIDFRKF